MMANSAESSNVVPLHYICDGMHKTKPKSKSKAENSRKAIQVALSIRFALGYGEKFGTGRIGHSLPEMYPKSLSVVGCVIPK